MKEKEKIEKELYEQKMRLCLDQWRTELDRLKAKAQVAGPDAQPKLNRQIAEFDIKLHEGETRLSALTETSDDNWESMKEGLKAAWESLTEAFMKASKYGDT
jgi:hypothetical protein